MDAYNPTLLDSKKFFSMGIGYLDIGMYENALSCFTYVAETLRIKENSTENKIALAKCYSLIGRCQVGLGGDGTEWQKKAYKQFCTINKESPCPEAIASCLNSFAVRFEIEKNYKKALRYRKKALRYLQKDEKPHKIKIALEEEALGILYRKKNDDEKALMHMKNALELVRSEKKPALQERINRNLGELLYSMKDYKAAYPHVLESARLQEELHADMPYRKCFEQSYFTLGSICDELKEYERALTYYLKSYAVASVNYKDKKGESFMCLLYRSIYYDYLTLHQTNKAAYYYKLWEKEQTFLVQKLQKRDLEIFK